MICHFRLPIFFLLKRADSLGEAVDITNAVIWVIGFVLYRILMRIDIPVGNTLPDMVVTILICMIVRNVLKSKKLDFHFRVYWIKGFLQDVRRNLQE